MYTPYISHNKITKFFYRSYIEHISFHTITIGLAYHTICYTALYKHMANS